MHRTFAEINWNKNKIRAKQIEFDVQFCHQFFTYFFFLFSCKHNKHCASHDKFVYVIAVP